MPVITCPDCGRDVSTLAPTCPHCGRPSPSGMVQAAAPASALKEETLWRGTPSAAVLAGRVAGMILVLIAIPVAAHFLASVNAADIERSAQFVRIGWILTAVVLLLQIVLLAAAYARLRSTSYTITTQRLIIERGLLSKSLNEIDLRTVDDTQFFQSVTDRLLGIGNVTLISSDKSLPTFVLHSIRDPRGVREVIRTNAYQVSQRQIFTRAT